MERRKALKQLGLGLSGGILLPSYLMSCSKDDRGPEVPYDGNVIVIGAGAAGLYAADILRVKGIKVTILEASSQPGGRIRSLRNQTDAQYQSFNTASQADFPIELGGEVVYGSNSSWGKLISDLSLPNVEVDPTAPRYILDNQAKTGADWKSDSDWNAVQNFVNGLPNFTGGNTVQTAAAVSTRAQALLNSQTGNFYGTTSDRIGARGLAESLKLSKRDTKQLMTRANPWQDIIISRFSEVIPSIVLNTVVKKIDWSSTLITITDSNGKEYTATKVIVTVPLSILKNGDITFTPGLDATKTSALAKFKMDAAMRIVLDFKTNFWGLDSSYIWGGSTVPQYFNSGVGRSKFFRSMALTIYGQKAEQLSALSDYNKVLTILAELDAVYQGQATRFIRRDLDNPNDSTNLLYLVKDWTKDEYIKGGFSYPLVGTTNADRKDLSLPLADKLYFAGEATDVDGDSGTVSGALNSAARVVEEIVKSIRGI
ncbi:MAG: FAD-dependent oxidoreductase [Cytophagales bacterium]|nr:FAD-dependent oxidoreductase [Cytophagales bacterium]MCA6366925.1 FAD-dependent oxidoreductase [Cytophagales bacterium]MCA6370981.1 FAD-dependent oxidoreductase [Cytophagales bacterium]MCA6375398.1 FAD-dependent oxidoreductase [Cytophagales bacterium]MCA6382099.1 FAD-dependent oxidoreductase [Cytophagales bacterium]